MSPRNVTQADIKQADRLAFSLEAAAAQLSVSPSFLRLEIARGRIQPVRLGRRILISSYEIERYLHDAAFGQTCSDKATR
jgi:excisionase family DNA binding protein